MPFRPHYPKDDPQYKYNKFLKKVTVAERRLTKIVKALICDEWEVKVGKIAYEDSKRNSIIKFYLYESLSPGTLASVPDLVVNLRYCNFKNNAELINSVRPLIEQLRKGTTNGGQ